MARKRIDSERTEISPELHGRIVELSTLLWQGNRSKMARELGIDQPTISRVLSGDQKPSGKFLEKLANCSQVNVGWLFLGQGEPQAVPGMRPGLGAFRPLLDEILPGTLVDHKNHTDGVSYPVATAFGSLTSYWYRVASNSSVTKSNHCVKSGDLLLMETDPGWTRSGSAILGKFCGLFGSKVRAKEPVLGWVDSFDHSTWIEGFEQYRVEMFGKPGKAWLIIPLENGGETKARRSLAGVCLTLQEIVCVAIKLERSYVKGAGR